MVDNVKDDQGAPVYLPLHNPNGQIYRVRPVGILFSYTEE